MKAKLVNIGNSRGVRIPKAFIEQAGLTEDVLLEATNGAILIRAARGNRTGWDAQFAAMANNQDDQLVEGTRLTRTRWEKEEWQW